MKNSRTHAVEFDEAQIAMVRTLFSDLTGQLGQAIAIAADVMANCRASNRPDGSVHEAIRMTASSPTAPYALYVLDRRQDRATTKDVVAVTGKMVTSEPMKTMSDMLVLVLLL